MLPRWTVFRLGLSCFALLSCFGQSAVGADGVYQVLTDTAGRQIEARILGFSLGQKAPVQTVKALTPEHLVHLRVKGKPELFTVQVKIFSVQSQGLLEKLNRLNVTNGLWNVGAVEAARTVVDSYIDLMGKGTDLGAIEVSLNETYGAYSSGVKKQPLVRFTWALIQMKLGKKVGTTLDSVIRSEPRLWAAWRAAVCVKLVDVNALSAAAKLKSFHRAVLVELRQGANDQEVSKPTVENLLWIKQVIDVFATNEAAGKIVASMKDDPETTAFLHKYQTQIALENAKLEEELRERAEEDRERIKLLVSKANMEYEATWLPLLEQYNLTEAEYNKHYPEYQRLDSQASIARGRADAADAQVTAQNRVIDNLRSRRNDEEDDDRKQDIDDEISDEQEVLRALENSASAARSAASAAESAARSYYNSVLAPLKAKMFSLYQRGLAFHAQFRSKHAEAIANDPGLKMIFDKWDAWVARIQKERLGVSRANTITRKDLKEKAKAKQKEEALELLSLIKFSVDSEIQVLSQELSERYQALAR